jgi:hypothetical protein
MKLTLLLLLNQDLEIAASKGFVASPSVKRVYEWSSHMVVTVTDQMHTDLNYLSEVSGKTTNRRAGLDRRGLNMSSIRSAVTWDIHSRVNKDEQQQEEEAGSELDFGLFAWLGSGFLAVVSGDSDRVGQPADANEPTDPPQQSSATSFLSSVWASIAGGSR